MYSLSRNEQANVFLITNSINLPIRVTFHSVQFRSVAVAVADGAAAAAATNTVFVIDAVGSRYVLSK